MNNKTASEKRTDHRYALLDALRGITIISMVLFHFSYDVCIVFGKAPGWNYQTGPYLWQQSICWSFILLSGFVWSYGKQKNLRRGILLNLCGLLITLVTVLFLPSEAIWFGVLNFIGCAVLLMIPLHSVAEKIPPVAGILCSFLLFLFFRHVQNGILGFGPLLQFRLPDALYSAKVLTPFGFPYPGFRSSDYFPILPWFFLFLCGWFGNRIFRQHPAWQSAAKKRIPFLSSLGTKSLWIYLLHQPVCYAIAFLFFR